MTVDQIIMIARKLPLEEKLRLIEDLKSDATAVAAQAAIRDHGESVLDDQYQRGYEKFPEDTAEAEAMLLHLMLPAETWE